MSNERDAHVEHLSTGKTVLRFLAKQYLAGVVVVVAVAIGFFEPAILSPGTINSVLFQAALTGIAALGMTLLIAEGSLDLSVPGVLSLAGLTAALSLPHMGAGPAMALAALVGVVAGVLNGVLVAYIEIPAFISTLGTQYLFLGVAFIITAGGVRPLGSPMYARITNASFGFLPLVFIVFLTLAFLAYALLYWTRFGRDIRAIGSNERAARLAAVATNRVKVMTFAFAGLMFAIAGIFLAGRLSSASGTMATGTELNAIAAVVVGGTSLRGGRATIAGTVVGAILFSLLSTALNILRIGSYWQYVLTGAVLAVAVAIGTLRKSAEVRGAE